MPSVPVLGLMGGSGSASPLDSRAFGSHAGNHISTSGYVRRSYSASDGTWDGGVILPEAHERIDLGQVLPIKEPCVQSGTCSDAGAAGVQKNESNLRRGKWTTEEETCVYINQNTTKQRIISS